MSDFDFGFEVSGSGPELSFCAPLLVLQPLSRLLSLSVMFSLRRLSQKKKKEMRIDMAVIPLLIRKLLRVEALSDG